MSTQRERLAVFVFGVVFVTTILVLAVFFPNPTDFQYTVFRIVLALAAAGVAAFVPGFLELQVNSWLRAGGAMAVFVIVYFYSPAQMVYQLKPPEKGKEASFVSESLIRTSPEIVLDPAAEVNINDPLPGPEELKGKYSLKFTVWNNSPFEKIRVSEIEGVLVAQADTISFCCPETRSLFKLSVGLKGPHKNEDVWNTTVEIPPLSSHSFEAQIETTPGDPDRMPQVWLGLVATYTRVGGDGLQYFKSDKIYRLNSGKDDGIYNLGRLKQSPRANPHFDKYGLDKAIAWLSSNSIKPLSDPLEGSFAP